jgi:TonB family protein
MRSEQVLAAAGALTFHGLCVTGLLFWNTGLPITPAAPVAFEANPSSSVVAPGNAPASTIQGKADDGGLAASASSSIAPVSDTASADQSARELLGVPGKNEARAETKSTTIVEGSYSWPEGEKRKKVSGSLPRPLNAGTTSEMVSLDLTVSPNGTVHAIKVLDPSGSGFEREASRVLRRWRFEVLPRSKPQRDYHCTVTLRIKP